MTILDEFERKTIEVRSLDANTGSVAVTKHPAWCYGEIGILNTHYDGEPGFCLVCIPIGAVFPLKRMGIYFTIEDACGAAKEMARARNSWASVVRFDRKLIDTMESIASKYNGNQDVYVPPAGKIPPGDKLYLNGGNPLH